MRSATAVICLSTALIIPATAQERAGASEVARQAQERNWAGLETARGHTITVEDTSGKKTDGALLLVEATSLTLRVDGAVARIDRTQVRRVTSKRRDSAKNGALTGALIGAAMAAGSSCSGQVRKCGRAGRIAFIAFGAALWSAIGASIDSSIDKRVTLYESPPSPVSGKHGTQHDTKPGGPNQDPFEHVESIQT